jgi:hypothetical protein
MGIASIAGEGSAGTEEVAAEYSTAIGKKR